MIKKFNTHRGYYLILAGMQIVGFVLVINAGYDKTLVFSYVVLSTFFYMLWAYVHHFIHHDLSTKIVLEYMLMGVLGISVMFFFLR